MSEIDRFRLVILGGQGVGKSCILKRFLYKAYSDKYRATVEDLHSSEFDLGHMTLKVDMLDTTGDQQFPAMRRLSMSTAHGFILVYATTSESSFAVVKESMAEIRQYRPDFQEIPIVIAGNKSDLATSHREIMLEDVSEWLYCTLPRMRTRVFECSAKDDHNVTVLFKTLLSLSRILPVENPADTNDAGGLKRRSSAYVSASSKGKGRVNSPSLSTEKSRQDKLNDASGSEAKLKPRSRSLIRRSSRKSKQQIQHTNSEDCNVQ